MRKLILNLSLIITLLSNTYCANNLIVVYKNPDNSQGKMMCRDTSKAFHEANLFFFLNEYLTLGYSSGMAESNFQKRTLCYIEK